MEAKMKIGISTCLLGENVRYNGGHQLNRYLRDTLGNFVEFVPLCPEVGAGMGIPREPVRLVGTLENHRIVGRESGEDWTGRMREWSLQTLDFLKSQHLCGFVFKAKSPSSGLGRVKIYRPEGGQPASTAGRGYFAGMVMDAFPNIPFEDDGRLNDAGLRENFIIRAFARHRWHQAFQDGYTPRALVDFHTRHKLLLMSHSVEAYRQLGKLVATAGTSDLNETLPLYEQEFFKALSHRATVRRHVNVLQHIMGYFKKQLSADEKAECLEVIEKYHAGLIPLIVPITLLRHYVRKFGQSYLAEQIYLAPHPDELMLRNHV